MISKTKKIPGFTLIEVLIGSAMVALIASLGLFLSFDFYKSYLFHYEEDLVTSILQKARSQALANIDQVRHGVHIDYAANPKTYTIFENTYAAGAAGNQVFENNRAVTPGGLTEVVFDQLTGAAAVAGGNLTLSDGIHTAIISVNAEGRIYEQ
jgi:prepilin-type N-terminal cleavage/methylation domain-containing protein